MEKVHDVGGKSGFDSFDVTEIGKPFQHEWEARVFTINRLLLKAGVYNLDEFRYAVERIGAPAYFEMSYYERWLTAIERLLAEKGVLAP